MNTTNQPTTHAQYSLLLSCSIVCVACVCQVCVSVCVACVCYVVVCVACVLRVCLFCVLRVCVTCVCGCVFRVCVACVCVCAPCRALPYRAVYVTLCVLRVCVPCVCSLCVFVACVRVCVLSPLPVWWLFSFCFCFCLSPLPLLHVCVFGFGWEVWINWSWHDGPDPNVTHSLFFVVAVGVGYVCFWVSLVYRCPLRSQARRASKAPRPASGEFGRRRRFSWTACSATRRAWNKRRVGRGQEERGIHMLQDGVPREKLAFFFWHGDALFPSPIWAGKTNTCVVLQE